jgi:hypothetical protein
LRERRVFGMANYPYPPYYLARYYLLRCLRFTERIREYLQRIGDIPIEKDAETENVSAAVKSTVDILYDLFYSLYQCYYPISGEREAIRHGLKVSRYVLPGYQRKYETLPRKRLYKKSRKKADALTASPNDTTTDVLSKDTFFIEENEYF